MFPSPTALSDVTPPTPNLENCRRYTHMVANDWTVMGLGHTPSPRTGFSLDESLARVAGKLLAFGSRRTQEIFFERAVALQQRQKCQVGLLRGKHTPTDCWILSFALAMS